MPQKGFCYNIDPIFLPAYFAHFTIIYHFIWYTSDAVLSTLFKRLFMMKKGRGALLLLRVDCLPAKIDGAVNGG